MSQNEQQIFTVVVGNERLRVLKQVLNAPDGLVCKIERSYEMLSLKAFEMVNDDSFLCRKAHDVPIPSVLPSLAVVSFSVGADRYYFSTELAEPINDVFKVKIGAELFLLPRRKSQRLPIPSGYPASAVVTAIDMTKVELNVVIQDLSREGCRLFFPQNSPIVAKEQQLEGQLHLGNRTPFRFGGRICYLQEEKNGCAVGVEFSELTPMFVSRISAITLELQQLQFQGRKAE